jgi:hypothetical protein
LLIVSLLSCRSTPLEFNFGAVKIGGQANSPLFELARVLVLLDHVARFIVNAMIFAWREPLTV